MGSGGRSVSVATAFSSSEVRGDVAGLPSATDMMIRDQL